MIVIGFRLGDYLRAVAVLDAANDPALCGRIAAILGVESRGVVAPEPGSAEVRETRTRQSELSMLIVDDPVQVPAEVPHGKDAATNESTREEVEVTRVPAKPRPDRALPQMAAPAGPPPPLPHEPLFDPQRSRALISAALAAVRTEGEIDEPALIDRIACARPVLAIPRRPRLTLARGVQVLVDLCPSMLPFRRDQDDLLLRIDRLVTDGLLEVRTFKGDPCRVWSRGQGMRAYQPPRTGTPVLALTDLGVREAREGRFEIASGWLAFTSRLAQAGVPFVALVPYPPTALPRGLLERIAVVQWDRPTSVSSVQRAAARARRR